MTNKINEKGKKILLVTFLCRAISNAISYGIAHEEFPEEWDEAELRSLIAELAIKLMTFTREDATRRRNFGTILDSLHVPTRADLEAGMVRSWKDQTNQSDKRAQELFRQDTQRYRRKVKL
jgi:hypothetical protein